MPQVPTPIPSQALARFPAEVLEAFKRYRATGEPGALESVVVAAAVDYRPAGSGPAQAVSDATRLQADLGYDSVAVAELVFFLEDLFEMTITNEDIIAVNTIGDLRACVIRKLAAKSVGA